MNHPTILIADDHDIVVDGLRGLLQSEFDVVGSVSDGRDVDGFVTRLKPDVVILDVSMPSLNGLDCARHLRSVGFPGRILILTMHSDATMAEEALVAGANGFIVKTAPASELRAALHQILLGQTYLSSAVAENLAHLPGRADSARKDTRCQLTARQREVLQLLAEGKSHKEVAVTLNISVKTAEFHKYAIFGTLGIRTNAGLVQYAIRHGIIGP